MVELGEYRDIDISGGNTKAMQEIATTGENVINYRSVKMVDVWDR